MPDRSPGSDEVSVRIPRQLRDCVDTVFEVYRGCEPATFQESLSLVLDLAENRLDASPDVAGSPRVTEDARETTVSAVESTRRNSGDVEAAGTGIDFAEGRVDAGAYEDVIDQTFPYDWDANPAVGRRLPAVVARYVDNPNGYADPNERERDAIEVVAREEDTDPDLVRESLVSTLYGGAGLSTHLADEFFSEALEEAETVASRQPTGERAATSDGGVASDPTPDSLSDLIEMGSEDEPTADCEECEATKPVGELETVIGPEDGSTVRLLCPDCADITR